MYVGVTDYKESDGETISGDLLGLVLVTVNLQLICNLDIRGVTWIYPRYGESAVFNH